MNKYTKVFSVYIVFLESFGNCESGSISECCPQDVGCYVECKEDKQCRYADWVIQDFNKESNTHFRICI